MRHRQSPLGACQASGKRVFLSSSPPDRDCYEGGFHAFFPSWERFWEQGPDGSDVPAPAPIDSFLESFREGMPEKLSVRVR